MTTTERTPALGTCAYCHLGAPELCRCQKADSGEAGLGGDEPKANESDKLLEGEAVAWRTVLGPTDIFEIAEIIRTNRGVKQVRSRDYAVADEIAAYIERSGVTVDRDGRRPPAHPAPIEAGLREKVARIIYDHVHVGEIGACSIELIGHEEAAEAILSALQSEGVGG